MQRLEADCVEARFNHALVCKRIALLPDSSGESQRSMLEQALKDLTAVEKLAPTSPDIKFQLGEVLDLLGNFQEAIKAYNSVNSMCVNGHLTANPRIFKLQL